MFQSAKYQYLRDEVHNLDRIVDSLTYRLTSVVEKLEIMEKRIPVDQTDHIQNFKDEVYGELYSIKKSLFDLEKDSIVRKSQKSAKLEDLSENEWDRLTHIINETYAYHSLDSRSIILQRFRKIKNG